MKVIEFGNKDHKAILLISVYLKDVYACRYHCNLCFTYPRLPEYEYVIDLFEGSNRSDFICSILNLNIDEFVSKILAGSLSIYLIKYIRKSWELEF